MNPAFEDFRDLADVPILIQVGTHELVRDDATDVVVKLRKVNPEVIMEFYDPMWHNFMMNLDPSSNLGVQVAWARVRQFIRAATASCEIKRKETKGRSSSTEAVIRPKKTSKTVSPTIDEESTRSCLSNE